MAFINRTFNSAKYGTVTIVVTRSSGNLIWNASVPLTEDEQRIVQEKCGYSPCGYGFFKTPKKRADGNAKWGCYNNCD